MVNMIDSWKWVKLLSRENVSGKLRGNNQRKDNQELIPMASLRQIYSILRIKKLKWIIKNWMKHIFKLNKTANNL